MNEQTVSLVIPGRNCARTIRQCLDAVVPLQNNCQVSEIIFVDDGSDDDTPEILSTYSVKYIRGVGGGPGAARNLGWRAASSALIWFIDSDCVAEPDALSCLLPHMKDPAVGGVSGSYGNMRPDSLLACLIHEEIIERHRRMPSEVNFLGGFNVLYRRDSLVEVGGFDETSFNGPLSPGAEDAELAFRVHLAGHQLRFEPRSIVKHYHPTNLRRYLRAQRHHGYWRVWLYLSYRDKMMGDSYSSLIDHIQPPLAMLSLATLPLLIYSRLRWVPAVLFCLLLLTQIPMTLCLLRRLRQPRYASVAPMSLVRAYWRGFGMIQGAVSYAACKINHSN